MARVLASRVLVALLAILPAAVRASPAAPTFYRDVAPILQAHCQICHRPGEIAPMPFLTYKEVRPWAQAIRKAVLAGEMPPWFADPCCGKFSNDPTLSPAERQTIASWVSTGAAPGDPHAAPPPRAWTAGWRLPHAPDLVLRMPQAFQLPADKELQYQYFVVPTGFKQDRWVTAAELRPGNRSVVHHAVVYIREPGDTWTHGPTKNDILAIYAPGSSPDILPPGMAKLVKAGSDLVFEMHYTAPGKLASEAHDARARGGQAALPAGSAANVEGRFGDIAQATPGPAQPTEDRSEVGLIFAKAPPKMRVLTLQMDSTDFIIPPGDPDHRVEVWGTLPNDALLLSFFPHMHYRGKAFEYARYLPDGTRQTMLKVSHYNFYWQLTYRLAQPLPLKKGTRLEWVAWFDNSKNNPRNPDPDVAVRYGLQSWDEMMVGFFDVAVDPSFDKKAFFKR